VLGSCSGHFWGLLDLSVVDNDLGRTSRPSVVSSPAGCRGTVPLALVAVPLALIAIPLALVTAPLSTLITVPLPTVVTVPLAVVVVPLVVPLAVAVVPLAVVGAGGGGRSCGLGHEAEVLGFLSLHLRSVLHLSVLDDDLGGGSLPGATAAAVPACGAAPSGRAVP